MLYAASKERAHWSVVLCVTNMPHTRNRQLHIENSPKLESMPTLCRSATLLTETAISKWESCSNCKAASSVVHRRDISFRRFKSNSIPLAPHRMYNPTEKAVHLHNMKTAVKTCANDSTFWFADVYTSSGVRRQPIIEVKREKQMGGIITVVLGGNNNKGLSSPGMPIPEIRFFLCQYSHFWHFGHTCSTQNITLPSTLLFSPVFSRRLLSVLTSLFGYFFTKRSGFTMSISLYVVFIGSCMHSVYQLLLIEKKIKNVIRHWT